MSLFGFTFITDSKLSMYREKAMKAEQLAKEVEELEDMAVVSEKRMGELNKKVSVMKSEVASKDKEMLSIGKDLSLAKEEVSRLKESQKKLIASVRMKTDDLEEVGIKIKDYEENAKYLKDKIKKLDSSLKKKSDELIEARTKIGDLENNNIVNEKIISNLESELKLARMESKDAPDEDKGAIPESPSDIVEEDSVPKQNEVDEVEKEDMIKAEAEIAHETVSEQVLDPEKDIVRSKKKKKIK